MLDRPVDGRSDLYELGAFLFHCATGHPPYEVESATDIKRRHATAPVPDPREGPDHLPERLALESDDIPLLILAVYDEGGGTETVDRLETSLREILELEEHLGPMGPEALEELIRTQLGNRPVDMRLVERITTLSHGNPYAAAAYVRAVLDGAVLRPTWNGWEIDDGALEELDLPEELSALLVERLERLDDEQLRDHHQRAADVLDDGSDDPAPLYQIAHHYGRGCIDDNHRRAFELNARASRLARDRLAHASHAIFLTVAGLHSRGPRHLELAREFAESADDPFVAGQVTMFDCLTSAFRGDPERADRIMREVFTEPVMLESFEHLSGLNVRILPAFQLPEPLP
jgi:hypothetical protein